MKSLAVYYSRGGKTRRVAEAVAQQLGCEAVNVEKENPDVSGVELLVVGSGQYPGKLHKRLESFLDGLQPSQEKQPFSPLQGNLTPKLSTSLKGLWKQKAT